MLTQPPQIARNVGGIRNAHAHDLPALLASANEVKSFEDFSVTCKAINALPAENRGEPLALLSERLLSTLPTMPIQTILPTCRALIESMNTMPVGGDAAKHLARPMLSVFDATQRMYKRALTQHPNDKQAFKEKDVLAPLNVEMIKLYHLIGKYGMAEAQHNETMHDLLGKCFEPDNKAVAVMWAVALFPLLMRDLKRQPGSAEHAEHVATMITSLTEHANGARGLNLLGPAGADPTEWAQLLGDRSAVAMQKHGSGGSSGHKT